MRLPSKFGTLPFSPTLAVGEPNACPTCGRAPGVRTLVINPAGRHMMFGCSDGHRWREAARPTRRKARLSPRPERTQDHEDEATA